MNSISMMKMSIVSLLSFISFIAMARPGGGWNPPSAHLQPQKLVLKNLQNFDRNQPAQGTHLTVKLKVQLKNQYGIQNTHKYRIDKIKVVSRDVDYGRRGRITSMVRYELGGRQVGQAATFSQNHNNNRYSAVITPPRRAFRQNGTWQLKTNYGYTDIKRVVLWLVPKRQNGGGGGWNPPTPPHNPRMFSVGKKRLEKWSSGVAFSVNRSTSAVSLKMHRNSAQVGVVRAFFRQGGSIDLHQLSGHYSKNQMKTQRLNRLQNISHIEIYNSQSGLIGGRTDVELLVGN